MAYDAISQVLATILNGAIGAYMAGPQAHTMDSGSADIITRPTKVMSTALIGLVSTIFSGKWGLTLSDISLADHDLAANRSLTQMIEELSRNQTLSSLSSKRLW